MQRGISALLSISTLLVAGFAAAQGNTVSPPEAEAFCTRGCEGVPNLKACVTGCLRSPGVKIIYTPEIVPLGTPVPLSALMELSPISFPVFKNQQIIMTVTDNVEAGGQLILRKGEVIYGHYVGNSCTPTVGVALDNSGRVTHGVHLANAIQWAPVSFRNPRDPASSDIIQVPTTGCFIKKAELTAYISGSPSEGTMAAAMAHARGDH